MNPFDLVVIGFRNILDVDVIGFVKASLISTLYREKHILDGPGARRAG